MASAELDAALALIEEELAAGDVADALADLRDLRTMRALRAAEDAAEDAALQIRHDAELARMLARMPAV
jgi:hypothetical protein